ncbi:glycosyltransferase involved in cell wall biosynthesis [Desulfofundulus luciae]|uniref:Glycosyltransferase involved in cell wall biosynthesis n=1 Tax=Desulfofundulus luciae TaxID=74702 RepID=A0ABU0AZV0_9FIRM|nr:glycosyltransferase family 4 protein [Desulfofundulus luciae]MDQ0285987.1 glycosyltransferase involved in cell wall biosynthesis [Desulfofundulus luciae]
MSKFKVLHVIRPARGGMKNHLLSLLSLGDKKLFEPVVACPPGNMIQEIADLGIKVVPIPLAGELSPRSDWRVLRILVDTLMAEKITIMHAHSAKAGLVARVAAKVARTPVVFMTAHNSIFYEFWPPWKKAAFAFGERLLARYTHRILTVSEALRQELLIRERLHPDRVVTIHNGIDPAPFRREVDRRAVLRSLGLPPLGRLVGTIARLAPQKGVSYFLQAAAILCRDYQVNFVVVGDGPLRMVLEEEGRALGLGGRLFFTGERRDIPQILAAMDVFVLPSITEGLPLTILEAMAAGKPVVATQVGGLPEVVVDGETGFLVPPRDPQALARALAQLLLERQKAEEMGQKGRQRVMQHFTVEAMVRKIEEEYKSALLSRGFLPARSVS